MQNLKLKAPVIQWAPDTRRLSYMGSFLLSPPSSLQAGQCLRSCGTATEAGAWESQSDAILQSTPSFFFFLIEKQDLPMLPSWSQLLVLSDPPASASQSAGIIGMSPHVQP